MALMKIINDYEFVGTQPAFSGELLLKHSLSIAYLDLRTPGSHY